MNEGVRTMENNGAGTQTSEGASAMNMKACHPQRDGCIKLAHAQDAEYVLQLAADLAELEREQDNDGHASLWQNYGNRDCIAACHIIERHPELMPGPSRG